VLGATGRENQPQSGDTKKVRKQPQSGDKESPQKQPQSGGMEKPESSRGAAA